MGDSQQQRLLGFNLWVWERFLLVLETGTEPWNPGSLELLKPGTGWYKAGYQSSMGLLPKGETKGSWAKFTSRFGAFFRSIVSTVQFPLNQSVDYLNIHSFFFVVELHMRYT